MPDDASTLFDKGVALHQAGRFSEAEVVYGEVLARASEHHGALHYLGLVAFQCGRYEEAVARISEALRVGADEAPPEYLVNLANALKRSGQAEASAAAYRNALLRRSEWPAAWFNLGLLERERGKLPDAVHALRRAATNLDFPEAFVELGECLFCTGDERAAFDCLQAAIPALQRRARNAKDAGACAYLARIGGALVERSRFEPARDLLVPLVRLHPSNADLLNVLGCAYAGLGELARAERVLRQACGASPDDERCLDNLAATLKDGAQSEESLAIYRRLTEGDTTSAKVASNYLFSLLYSDRESPRAILDEHRRLAGVFGRGPIPPAVPPTRSPPDGPIRIAYLSADLRNHPVAYFLYGLFASHDRSRFHLSVYDATMTSDAWTERLRSALAPCDDWCPVRSLSDQELATRIAEDRIDVLVELAGHTAGNRLAALKSHPARVQVSYLGYPHSTGLPWIDWRVVDQTTDPADQPDCGPERLHRLAGSYYAYSPPHDAPPVGVSPLEKNGFLTIGVCSNLAKVTPAALDVWAMILRELPEARFYWKARAFSDPQTRSRFTSELEARGVSPGRVTLDGWRSHAERWKSFAAIDVAMDTYPYNQATNTCEALWMGVPTISLQGREHRSRMGASILRAAGLEEWILDIADGMLEREELAAWLERRLKSTVLSELRRNLRATLAMSSLLDVKGATRRLESAYCDMLSERR